MICNAAYCRRGRSSCAFCAKTLRNIVGVDRGRRSHEQEIAGHEERIAKYAERAALKLPLFTPGDRPRGRVPLLTVPGRGPHQFSLRRGRKDVHEDAEFGIYGQAPAAGGGS